jgi:predicted PurR-regulated permease PerM
MKQTVAKSPQPDTVRIVKTVTLAASAVMALFLLWYARRVVMLTFAGLLFGIFLQSIANWVASHLKLRYGWSLLLVVLTLVALLAGAGWLVGARIYSQFNMLSDELPKALSHLRDQLSGMIGGREITDQLPAPSEIIQNNNLLNQLTGFTWGAFSVVAEIFVVLAVGLYGASQPELYRHGFVKLFPPAKRGKAKEIVDLVWTTLSRWVTAQIAAMAVVGSLTGAGLWLIGSQLPLALGLVAFGLSTIPNVGPFLSAMPAILLAWVQGPWFALEVIGLYIVVQVSESYAITPLIQLKATHLPPAVNILAVIFMGILGGFLGILIAAPLTITAIVLTKHLYVEDTLEDTHLQAVDP